MWFKKGFEKLADLTSGSAAGGLLSGYYSGRASAGTTANALSSRGSKVKNEELARTVAKLTGPLGAIAGLAAGYKHRHKLIGLASKHISNSPEMVSLYHAALPFGAGTAGGIAAGAGTGALISLRGRGSHRNNK